MARPIPRDPPVTTQTAFAADMFAHCLGITLSSVRVGLSIRSCWWTSSSPKRVLKDPKDFKSRNRAQLWKRKQWTQHRQKDTPQHHYTFNFPSHTIGYILFRLAQHHTSSPPCQPPRRNPTRRRDRTQRRSFLSSRTFSFQKAKMNSGNKLPMAWRKCFAIF